MCNSLHDNMYVCINSVGLILADSVKQYIRAKLFHLINAQSLLSFMFDLHFYYFPLLFHKNKTRKVTLKEVVFIF